MRNQYTPMTPGFNGAKNMASDNFNPMKVDLGHDMGEEMFNLNSGYLVSIWKLLEEFTLIRISAIGRGTSTTQEYFNSQIEVLENMNVLLQAKYIKKNKLEQFKDMEKRLEIIDDKINKSKMFVSNDISGDMIDTTQARIAKKELGKIMAEHLCFMEDVGMLSQKSVAPGMSFGEYTD